MEFVALFVGALYVFSRTGNRCGYRWLPMHTADRISHDEGSRRRNALAVGKVAVHENVASCVKFTQNRLRV